MRVPFFLGDPVQRIYLQQHNNNFTHNNNFIYNKNTLIYIAKLVINLNQACMQPRTQGLCSWHACYNIYFNCQDFKNSH